MSRASLLLCVLIAGCTGALRGGSFDLSGPHRWGTVNVIVHDQAAGFGLALCRVSLDDGDTPLVATTDSQGWAVLQPSWPMKKERQDQVTLHAQIACAGYHVPSTGQAALIVPVTVRGAETTTVVVELAQ